MPAGPVGSVWASGSWSETAWEADTWADAVSASVGYIYLTDASANIYIVEAVPTIQIIEAVGDIAMQEIPT